MKIAIFLLVLCCTTLLAVGLFATGNEKAVEKVSRVKSVLLGGDSAAVSQVKKQVVDDRHELIADLISILEMKPSDKTPDGFLGEPALAAVRLLGEVRAEEAITALADKLELTTVVWIRSPGAGYPCYAALVRIGKPASLECLKRVASEKFPESKDGALGRRELLLMVVQQVEGNEVAKFMLQRAIEKEQDKDKKANLTAALALLEKWIKEREKLEKELKEKFPPKDQNPPAPGDKPANTNPLEDELKKGGPKDWEAALADNNAQRRAIIKFLMERFKDEKETPDNRILAATLLGRTRTREAIDFLFQNISSAKVPIEIESDIDNLREYPCVYALALEATWEKVPAILDYLHAKHENIELIYIVRIVEKIPGDANMLGLLEQVYLRPANEIHKKNLRLVMDYLLNELRPGYLTPAQVERKKLLEDNTIEYGQLPGEGDKKPPEKDKAESCPSSPTPMEPADKPANP